MTTPRISRPKLIPKEALKIDPERLDRAIESMKRNEAYFREHMEELFEQCPEGWILIYGDQQVEMFEDPIAVAKRRWSLSEADRDGAIMRHQWSGTRIRIL